MLQGHQNENEIADVETGEESGAKMAPSSRVTGFQISFGGPCRLVSILGNLPPVARCFGHPPLCSTGSTGGLQGLQGVPSETLLSTSLLKN